jgi:hypothetical protein
MGTNRHDSSIDLFFALVRAGLWENCGEYQVSGFKFQSSIDWYEVYQLAEEQSVIGVVLAGIERLKNANLHLNQKLLLQWIGEVQMLEQQNLAMNSYINILNKKLSDAGICSVLLKGQGVGQCYERPLWRACGDIDLLLDANGYENAKKLLFPLMSSQ